MTCDAMLANKTGTIVDKADWQSHYDAMNLLLADSDFRSRCDVAAGRFASERFERQTLFECIVNDRYGFVYGTDTPDA